MNTQALAWLYEQAKRLKLEWFDYQMAFFNWIWDIWDTSGRGTLRTCLYYRTGAGKSITSLVAVRICGYVEVVVIAPPSTHDSWVAQGKELDIEVTCMSHAKFRMASTQLRRQVPVIADEFHMFGGHTGKGWKKLDQLARGLKAPLILASATPNYNDAERVYCIQKILDPQSVKGGYLQFLYTHCETEANHFSATPDVTGFRNYVDAANYLADLPGVHYLPDALVYNIQDYPIAEKIPSELTMFGYNRRRNKMIASGIEERHARVDLSLVNDNGHVEADVMEFVVDKIETAVESVLLFCNHSTVAEALQRTLHKYKIASLLITGKNTTKSKAYILDSFRAGECDVLIGTASLATGTDGLDKICDTLIIVDDTEDDALRRQLIGRIMPRGVASSATHKQVHRLVLQ